MNRWRQLSQACRDEKVFGRLMGAFFIIMAFFFVVIGVTVLPIFGFIVAIPLFLLGFYFFRKPPGEDAACGLEDRPTR